MKNAIKAFILGLFVITVLCALFAGLLWPLWELGPQVLGATRLSYSTLFVLLELLALFFYAALLIGRMVLASVEHTVSEL